MKVNLGCGKDYRDGWVNCDMSPEVRADKYFDVRRGLPFEDGSVEEIYAGGILEQIAFNEDFLFVMNECWRILKKDCEMVAVVPTAKSSIAFQDPFDCRYFTEETWNYLDFKNDYYERYGRIYGFQPWDVRNIETIPNHGIIKVHLFK